MQELTPDDFARIATVFVPESIAAMAVTPDGRHLAVAAGDKLHIYQIPAPGSSMSEHDFRRIMTLTLPDKAQCISFTQDGALLMAAIADKIHVYRLNQTPA